MAYEFIDAPSNRYEFVDTPKATDGMSTTEKVLAATGSGMSSAVRALGGGSLLEKFGLPATKEEADKIDADLMATRSGKVGRVLGMGAIAAPTALIPGANTYLGASLIGAGTGAALTEGDLEERAKGAVEGAAGGVLGKGAGDFIGYGARKLIDLRNSGREAAKVANSQKDAAFQVAQNYGYVVPPADVKGGFFNEALNGLSGKIKTAQVASQKNQETTNSLARKALGIAEDQPLTTETLDAFRKSAAGPYKDISSMGKFDATKATLPKEVSVSESVDPMLFGNKVKDVDAAELVRAWKQSNHDATGYYRAYARDANPDTLAKAKYAADSAKQIDSFLSDALSKAGKGDAVEALKEARRQIAKSYTVEKALNSSTGDVSAQVLAKELAKGKKLTGPLLDIANVAQAFPKATQLLKEAPKSVSPLDYAVGAMTGTATGNPLMLGAMLARPVARSAILSKPYQSLLKNDYSGGLLDNYLLPAAASELARKAIGVSGIGGLISN